MPSFKLMDARRKRLADIDKLMSMGCSPAEIQDTMHERYGVNHRTTRRDIFEVRKRWADEAEKENQTGVRRHMTRQMLYRIIRAAVRDKAYGPAVSGVKRLMELDGLAQPVKLDVRGAIEITKQVQVDLEVKEWFEKLATSSSVLELPESSVKELAPSGD